MEGALKGVTPSRAAFEQGTGTALDRLSAELQRGAS